MDAIGNLEQLQQKITQTVPRLPGTEPVIWLLDATYQQLEQSTLEQLFAEQAQLGCNFVVLTNLPELSDQSDHRISYLHSAPICRSHLYEALLIASKRKTKATPTTKNGIGFAAAMSVEEAKKQGKLILLAEDNLMNQKVIVDQLHALGYAVEVADDDAERARGLMYRDRLEEGTGMLFLHDAERPLAYWMKNTRIPLDILYFDTARKLVSQQRNVPPCSGGDSCPTYPSAQPARYVLELNAGEAERLKLQDGAELGLGKGIPPVR